MGFFKNLNKLTEQGDAMQQAMDVKAMNQDAMARMQDASNLMAHMTQQNTLAAALAANGVDGTASISAVRNTGSLVNYSPVLELDLVVMLPGRPPIPVTRRELVEQMFLGKAQPGNTLRVRANPDDPTELLLNWSL
jgi:hypothetical protein